MSVPSFMEYYPNEARLTKPRREFYRVLEATLRCGDYIDVEGNISYVFIYVYKLLADWNRKGFEELSEHLIYLSEIYSKEEKLSSACVYWAHDCLLGLERYTAFIEMSEPTQIFGTRTHSSNMRLNVQSLIGVEANPIDVLLMAGGRKTKFIVDNQALYRNKLVNVFCGYADQHNGWFRLFEEWGVSAREYGGTLFDGVPIVNKPCLGFNIACYYTAHSYLGQIKDLARQAENEARAEIGVPGVGEGWVSETSLFRKLEREFSCTRVVQHGRPIWLGRQHYDIWFPNWSIAVEYHGRQHFEPVEFFGGEESFTATVIRDKKKQNLSRRHGVKLFIVSDTDDQDKLIEAIHAERLKRKVRAPGT